MDDTHMGYHISEDLDAVRNEFCPSKGYFHCLNTCPIYRSFYCKGLSCNGALDKYPDKCLELMRIQKKECA